MFSGAFNGVERVGRRLDGGRSLGGAGDASASSIAELSNRLELFFLSDLYFGQSLPEWLVRELRKKKETSPLRSLIRLFEQA